MIGLAKGNSHNSYTDIECAMYCDQGYLRGYELGAHKPFSPVPMYQESDLLGVERVGQDIVFLQNGNKIGSCTKKLAGNIIADLSIHNTGKGGIMSAAWVGDVIIATPVLWKAQQCTVSSIDGKIVKSGCANGWNAGAYSTMVAPGDVTLQFRCTKAQHTMIGLAIGNLHSSYTDIDCAVYCDQCVFRVYELGSYKWAGPAYDHLAVLAVVRKGSLVSFVKDGVVLRTCGRRLSGNVIADLSIHNNGAGGILSAVWVGTVKPVPGSAVKWTGSACTKINTDGTAVKDSCGNGWNGGAYSSRKAPGDVTLQFYCTKAQHTMIGLAKGNSHNSYSDIDCAMYCDQGYLRSYELGAHKAFSPVPTYESRDLLAVERVGTQINFYKNGMFLKKCTKALTHNLIADLSIHNTGRGGISNAQWVGDVIYAHDVQWKGNTCTVVGDDGKIVKSGCGNGWNGGAYSRNHAEADITLQFSCTKAQHTMIGLALGNSHNSYTDIDCAVYCDQGVFRVYELGSYKWAGPAYTETDVLAVKRVGTRVQYFKNGVVLRTCARALSGNVIADLSIHNTGKGGILSAVWIGKVVAPKATPVVWQNQACTSTAASGNIEKNGCGNG